MINKALNHIEELLVTFLMGAATLIIFASVAHRYMAGVNVPGLQDWLLTLNFGWAQELCIIMFVWMAKFGAAYGVRTGIHVGVDVLINRLDDNLRGKFIVFGLLAGAQSQAVFILFMTQDALSRFESSRGWTAGVDASVALITVGADARVTTQTAQQPVVGFVLTNGGLMGSLSLNGNRVTPLEIG